MEISSLQATCARPSNRRSAFKRHLLLAACILGAGLAFAQRDQPQRGGHGLVARFAAANTTHDGHLTRAQAQAAGLRMVVRHSSEIDIQNKGYVTIDEIKTWRAAQSGRFPE